MTDEAHALLQNSEAWIKFRLGRFTASRAGDLMAKTKTGGLSASRSNLLAELIVERLTGEPYPKRPTAEMLYGLEIEPEARALYAWKVAPVALVGVIPHPTILMAAASPDGLVGDDGLVEIKCPNSATHIETLLNKTIERRYRLQMQFQLACSERKWCDFVSYDRRLSEAKRFWLCRVERDDALIREIEDQARILLAEVDDAINRLNQEYPELDIAA